MIKPEQVFDISLVDRPGLSKLNELAIQTKKSKVEGVIVECGVYRGGSALLLSNADRPMFLIDSFEKMPAPDTKHDLDWDAEIFWNTENNVNFTRNLLDAHGVKNYSIIISKLEDSAPILTFKKGIALLHLDVDLYQSYMTCLINLYPQVNKGGIIIVDDYGSYTGCRSALKDYFKAMPDLQDCGTYSKYWIKE